VLPEWIVFIQQSFLPKDMQEKYIGLLNIKHKQLFQ